MKTYFLVLLFSILAVSCSKKVEVKGNFAGGSPLERIEFIEASGVATLPLTNIGVDSKGSFTGSFEAPKNGMYIMTYAGKQAMVYLKGGQTLNISGQAQNFPQQFTVTGDAKNNNDLLKEFQKFFEGYAAKVNVGEMVAQDEATFLKTIDRIKNDIEKGIDAAAKKTSADSEVADFKKDELHASLLGLMNQYEMNHGLASQNPSFKVSKNFRDVEKKLEGDTDKMLRSQPIFRNYLLGKLSQDFQTFATDNNKDGKALTSELFAKFINTKKDLSQLAKDYLLGFVLSSTDIQQGMPAENIAKLDKVIKDNVKDAEIKKDLEKVLFVISGPKVGEAAPASKLIKQDGSSDKLFDGKGKPTLVMFYASWNPYISEATVPVLKEVVNFYKSKMNFTFVNVDDTKEQFVKTSNAMLKGIPGTNLYGEGGLNSQVAKDFGIYGFKLPSFIVLDKDGKIASRFFYNLGDPEIVTVLDKVTGLKAPMVQPEAHLQNDLLAPQNQAPQEQKAPATK
ncbi:TlpA family protein disulfide reductase [Candidatus Kaistella beijingensis]|uniref:TlpA family protein disulfide reductase n=1 Tax=Candidatus Kaistella beijingensis TaxID=2820270 RepID=UPI001CC3F426|nr:TlpA disulfide reductase family protein [Candidatus Kaistella beijingensis]UBB88671.1 TlpA family protein disulfide reductase [Candidatus Kaistella beijingensis]